MNLKLTVLKDTYSIYKFNKNTKPPAWIFSSDFYSITKTEDELSVVTLQKDFSPENTEINRNWRILKVIGPLDFSLVGIIAGISQVLKEVEISIFVVSSYNTDYVMVKEHDLDKAVNSLKKHRYILEI